MPKNLQMTFDGTVDRTYCRTHPWLRFSGSIDSRRISPKLWMMLGECNSKCEHLAKTPLREDTANRLHQVYLAKGILGTVAIEGNTLSEEEVLKHIDGQLNLPPSKKYLQQEIDNILTACNGLIARILEEGPRNLAVEQICEINRTILKDLPLEGGVESGILRDHSVGVGGVYLAAPAQDLEFLMSTLCEWLNSDEFKAPEGDEPYNIVYAILKAIIAHLYMAWIHPFGDGNGRTARLLEFQILIESGVPSPAAHLLSNHYNLTRTEYYRQLKHASKSDGNIWPFVEYAVEGLVDGLREQLGQVWQQQYDLTWLDYVASRFQRDNSRPATRRLHLIQELSHLSKPVAIGEITEISPLLAQEYAGKTQKTLSRDLKKLLKQELLVLEDGKYRARKEFVQAFRPASINDY